MTTPLLALTALHKHYQNGDTTVRALDGVSLTVGQGEFLAIMGPSGSGKSTLMHIIGCLDRPTTGSYRVRGTEAAALSVDALATLRRETFGFVFQRYHLLASATARENVEIPSVYAGLPKRQRMTRATQLLEQLGLGERTGHRPAALSGGQQQRVAIARALVNDPPVILADEPTGALDSTSGEEVLSLLKALHAEGRTIILITHAEDVARHASRIVRLHDGRIIEDSATANQTSPDSYTAVAAPNPPALRAAPLLQRGDGGISPTGSVSLTVQGVGEDFPVARDWPVAEGQFFNAEDTRRYAAVVVLGRPVADTLFPKGSSPIGQYILLRNVLCLVLGVMTKRGASPGSSYNPDDVIFVPLHTSLVRLFGKSYLSYISVKVADTADLVATQARITAVLKARHQAEDFRVISTTAILETAMATQDTFTLLLGTVAAISLLVGGIGVMNIMLVSVVERTREIGIRMATGARRRDIFLQFNIEAAVVCTAGGIIGILVGIGAGLGLRANGMAVVFSAGPALLAFVCASATGLRFGYLPARQAARLDPVIALASE